MKANSQDPILNQQWDEQLQLQPPLRPTNVSTSQAMNGPSRSNLETETSTATSATRRQVEITVDEGQGQQTNTARPADAHPNVTRSADAQPNVTKPATNR